MNYHNEILSQAELEAIGCGTLSLAALESKESRCDRLYVAKKAPHLSMVQQELFQLDAEHFDLRQFYFDRLPLALQDYFGRSYKLKLKEYGANDTAVWFTQEMARKMPRIQAVLEQYCDVFAFIRKSHQDLDFLAELDQGFYFEAGTTTEQAVEKVKQNAKALGIQFPMDIVRLEKNTQYLKQHKIKPLAYQTPEQIKEISLLVAYQLRQQQEDILKQSEHKAVDYDTAYGVALDCYRQMQKRVNALQIDAPFQRKALKGRMTPEEMETGFLKMTCEKWWARKFSILAKRMKEHLAIACGMVNVLAPYCSNVRLREFEKQRKANIDYIRSMIITNLAEPEEQLALFDAWLASASNPKIKRLELITRMKGYEEVADELEHEGWFITLTAPSKYHAMLSKTGGINQKWNGASPAETQAYLVEMWARIRAKLKRDGIEVYGFRVAEPHADATPHWHMILFMRPEDMQAMRRIMLQYALAQDGTEAGARKYRCQFKKIEKSKGTATGYLIKYVSKNIDGFGMDGELSDEANLSAKDNAMRVQAWSTLWGIRQFQQLGNTPVSLWRELRRLRNLEQADEKLEELRQLADDGNWKGFTFALGGPLTKRADLPAHLTYEPRTDESGEAAYTLYKEPSMKVCGVMNSVTGVRIKTRLKDWKIVVKPKNWEELQRQKQWQHATTEARANIEAEQLKKSGFSAEAQALLGELARPWTCVTNCTGSKNEQVSQSVRERLKNEMVILKGRATDYDVTDLIKGKRIPLPSTRTHRLYAAFRRGGLFTISEEKEV